jgi:hypothetical protein
VLDRRDKFPLGCDILCVPVIAAADNLAIQQDFTLVPAADNLASFQVYRGAMTLDVTIDPVQTFQAIVAGREQTKYVIE